MEEAQAGGRKESSHSSGKSRRAPLGPHVAWEPGRCLTCCLSSGSTGGAAPAGAAGPARACGAAGQEEATSCPAPVTAGSSRCPPELRQREEPAVPLPKRAAQRAAAGGVGGW